MGVHQQILVDARAFRQRVVCTLCGGKNYTGGLCHKHYRQAINTGRTPALVRPNAAATKGMSVAERLDFYSETDPATGCINWTGQAFKTGYGKLTVDGRTRLAHRTAFELERGPIPEGLNVLHRCDNPRCINVEHHFLGTLADNSHDRNLKDRQASVLSREQVLAILVDPRPHGPVAADYGVGYRTIMDIRHGRVWKHVPRPEALAA